MSAGLGRLGYLSTAQQSASHVRGVLILPTAWCCLRYIVGYYRPEQSFWDSIRTLFVLHNETGAC